MKFGIFPLDHAEGVTLAHSFRHERGTLRKGHRLTAADLALMRSAGATEVIGARLDPGDVAEDEAAARIARRLAGAGVKITAARTGRCNLEAEAAGVARIDAGCITALNGIDESVTVATVAQYEAVRAGQIVATVKIIPFAVTADVMTKVDTAIAAPAVSLVPYRARRYALISTVLATVKSSVVTTTEDLTAARVASCGGQLISKARCPHERGAVEQAVRAAIAAGAEAVLIAAASATVDRQDVVPAGIVAAGGAIDHFGMPVDPGNLLVLAHIGADRPVLILPGCARSPKLNGFDWVLQRLAAGIPIAAGDIMGMGVGGLLVDAPSRPLPRDRAVRAAASNPAITAIVLAAGRSRRMGEDRNKLTIAINGTPLIRRSVTAVLESRARPVLVVTGHQSDIVRVCLAGLDVIYVHNSHYAEGLSTSLRAGLDAVPAHADGALVCLGDMPAVSAAHIDALIAGFDPQGGRAIGVATHNGKRGNPTLWARSLFEEMRAAAGDVGARHLIGVNESLVYQVEFEDTAVLTDLDTPAQWAEYLSRS